MRVVCVCVCVPVVGIFGAECFERQAMARTHTSTGKSAGSSSCARTVSMSRCTFTNTLGRAAGIFFFYLWVVLSTVSLVFCFLRFFFALLSPNIALLAQGQAVNVFMRVFVMPPDLGDTQSVVVDHTYRGRIMCRLHIHF